MSQTPTPLAKLIQMIDLTIAVKRHTLNAQSLKAVVESLLPQERALAEKMWQLGSKDAFAESISHAPTATNEEKDFDKFYTQEIKKTNQYTPELKVCFKCGGNDFGNNRKMCPTNGRWYCDKCVAE